MLVVLVLDKLLDEKFSDSKGVFNLAGSKKELTTIDPKVNIYHKCNYEGVSVHFMQRTTE